jgi:hypothetical protein
LRYPSWDTVPPRIWETSALVAALVFSLLIAAYELWAASRGLGDVATFSAAFVPAIIFAALGLVLRQRRQKLARARELFLNGLFGERDR